MSIRVLCPFLTGLFSFLLLRWKVSLYILDNKDLSPVGFTDMFIHSGRCLFTLLILCFTCKYAKPSPTWLNSMPPGGSVYVCFSHPNLSLITGVQKGMVTSKIKSLFVLISPGNLSRSFPSTLLGCAPVLFPLFPSWFVEGHWCAPKCPSLPFLSLIPNLSVVCDYWPLKISFSCSQNPWSILWY